MLMADAQQAQKESGPHEEYTMDSFPRYREADHVLKYTVRVALRGIKPPIWRKVIVPSNISLRLFGDLILELMGWMGEHLNQFRAGVKDRGESFGRHLLVRLRFTFTFWCPEARGGAGSGGGVDL